MFDYLRRLATTGAAYTAASVLSKLLAVALLPVYTAYLTPADYGAAEVMIAALVAASIVVRLGVIEAILRFYYVAGEAPAEVVRTGFASLFWSTTAVALLLVPFAGPISELLLAEEDPRLGRLAILGLWQLTLWEYVLTLLRLDERARAYLALTLAAVAGVVPVTVALVVLTDLGAAAILLGNFGTGALFLLWRVWVERHRIGLTLDRGLLRRMLRFGLPTMPAELTLYSLNFVDRIIIVRFVGLAEAGLYALATKFANGIQILVRGFHLAWPPLAYSIQDDEEARRAYALVVTWFTAICAFAVMVLWVLAPWIVDLFADERYLAAHEAIGPLAAGVSLYAVYLVMVVILGRTGRTERSFPAALSAVAANVVLNLLLVPPFGIVGAAAALGLSYVVAVAVMYVLTRRLFAVPYEWRRLALVLAAAALPVVVAEVFVPDAGIGPLAITLGLCGVYPLVLLAGRFLSAAERRRFEMLLRGARRVERRRREGGRAVDEPGPRRPRLTPEALEQAERDADRGGA